MVPPLSGKIVDMSWLKDLVRPRIATRQKRDVKANVWQKCPSCGEMLYQKDLSANLNVCTHCGYHLRISVEKRLEFLIDADSASFISVKAPTNDPLKFKDSKRYPERLRDARKKTGQDDAFRLLTAKINGKKVVVLVMDFAFMGGSMGPHVGEAIVQGAKTALNEKRPYLVIAASGGARMQEGILSLMQMARTSAALANLKEACLPYLVLLTDPTTGGVTASFAMQGDITMAEPGALIGFAGPRVIQQTIGENLPEGFQRSEYLLEHGMVDMIVSRQEQPATIARLISFLHENKKTRQKASQERAE